MTKKHAAEGETPVHVVTGSSERLQASEARQYERVQSQAETAQVTEFEATTSSGRYGGAMRPRTPTPMPGAESRLHEVEDRILSLPFQDRLALLRSLAPQILESLSPNDRDAFFLSLSEELERRVGGQGSLPYQ